MPDRSASVAIEVVIPARNGAAHLAATLASIEASASPAPGVVLVDHGSEDDTATIARQHGVGRIACVDASRLLCDVYNAGIAATSAELVALMGQDDLYLPGALDRLRDALTARPDAGFAHGAVQYFAESSHDVPPTARADLTDGPRVARLFETTLWRRSTLVGLGELLPGTAGDVDLFLRAADAQVPAASIDELVCRKRLVPTSAGQRPEDRALLASVRASIDRKTAGGS
jgi:glycosyltransferase involved in cell wall biosynthesis